MSSEWIGLDQILVQREVDEVFGGGGPRRAWHLDRVKLRLGVEWAEDGSGGRVGWRPSSSPSASAPGTT